MLKKTGKKENYQNESSKNILKQIPSLKDVEFIHSEFDLLNIPQNSFVYCDPPYAKATKYHCEFDSDKFWNWVREKSETNTVIVSEYSAPDDFECIWEKEISSVLSGSKKQSVEKLFMKKA